MISKLNRLNHLKNLINHKKTDNIEIKITEEIPINIKEEPMDFEEQIEFAGNFLSNSKIQQTYDEVIINNSIFNK